LIFEGKKSSGDYHGSFNFKVFQDWFTKNLIPNLPTKKSCIVIDRATYHLVPKENIVVSEMRKLEIQTWLTEHEIPWESYWLKPKLVEVIADNIDKTPLVSQIAEQHGHKVLILPVHHPELNPIELVWGFAKNECARQIHKDLSL